MRSPLELQRSVLEILDIRANPLYTKDCAEESYNIKVATEVSKKPDSYDYRIKLGVRMSPPKDTICRFQRIEVEIIGYFNMPQDSDPNFVYQLVPLNCLAILYGIARGVVAQSTGLTRNGAFMLPAYNFVEHINKKHKSNAPHKQQN